MPVDAELVALAQRVGAFHITDRAMKRAQSEIDGAIGTGTVDARLRDAYLGAVRRYFEGFHGEARAHLRDVDRRIEEMNQVLFNLNAERGVAVKRIEATRAVLNHVASLTERVGQ